jgi:hypothetical protein
VWAWGDRGQAIYQESCRGWVDLVSLGLSDASSSKADGRPLAVKGPGFDQDIAVGIRREPMLGK